MHPPQPDRGPRQIAFWLVRCTSPLFRAFQARRVVNPRERRGWLSGHLNAYLRDDDEYRAITRQTIIRGLAGTITCTPAAITVTLEQPASRRVARALELLLDEINADPPAIPGDTRPINYQITPHRI